MISITRLTHYCIRKPCITVILRLQYFETINVLKAKKEKNNDREPLPYRKFEVSSRWTRSLIGRLKVTCLRLKNSHKKSGLFSLKHWYTSVTNFSDQNPVTNPILQKQLLIFQCFVFVMNNWFSLFQNW